MLFTWDTKDLCIVFHGWHINGTASLIFSLLAIVLLTAGYEAVREASRRYDPHARRIAEGRRDGDDLSSKPPSSLHTGWVRGGWREGAMSSMHTSSLESIC